MGIAVALLAEFLDHRIYDEGEFEKLVPVEVMAEIPPLITMEEETTQRRRFGLELAAVSVMGMAVLMGVAISFLRG